jgi:hypothetical protein
MTGPTDPALRALNFLPIPEQVLGNKDRQLGWAICRNQAMEAVSALAAAEAAPLDGFVAVQVRLTHKPVTNPMYPKPLCNHDGEEWPCLTELQVTEGLYLARAALRSPDTETAGDGL